MPPQKHESSTRLCLLDALGCILYGASLAEGNVIIRSIEAFGAGSIPLPGSLVSLTPDSAAYAMGTLCHLRELDDVHVSIIHPGAVIVPAALSAAYTLNLSLGEMLDAIFYGYEVAARISRGIGYLKHREQGWHGTSTICPFGVAMAVSDLLKLEETETVWALGIAGTRSGGTWAFAADGAMTKRLHPGMAARDGLQAAFLARSGITGPQHILEAEDGGLYRIMSRDWDLSKLCEEGQIPAVSDVEFKWYASCKSVHSPQEAATTIYQKRVASGLSLAPTAIRVQINSSAMHMAGRMYDPSSITSAQLSIPYGIALALSGRDGSAGNYSEDFLTVRQLYTLASMVQMEVSAEMDNLRAQEHTSSAIVEVTWDDQTVSREFVKAAKGSIERPLSRDEIVRKFESLVIPVVGEAACRRIIEMVLTADRSTQITSLEEDLRPHRRD